MATDMERVTVLLPKDVYKKLIRVSEQRHESMSNIGRRLFMDWLEENPPKVMPPIEQEDEE